MQNSYRIKPFVFDQALKTVLVRVSPADDPEAGTFSILYGIGRAPRIGDQPAVTEIDLLPGPLLRGLLYVQKPCMYVERCFDISCLARVAVVFAFDEGIRIVDHGEHIDFVTYTEAVDCTAGFCDVSVMGQNLPEIFFKRISRRAERK